MQLQTFGQPWEADQPLTKLLIDGYFPTKKYRSALSEKSSKRFLYSVLYLYFPNNHVLPTRYCLIQFSISEFLKNIYYFHFCHVGMLNRRRWLKTGANFAPNWPFLDNWRWNEVDASEKEIYSRSEWNWLFLCWSWWFCGTIYHRYCYGSMPLALDGMFEHKHFFLLKMASGRYVGYKTVECKVMQNLQSQKEGPFQSRQRKGSCCPNPDQITTDAIQRRKVWFEDSSLSA